MEHDRDDSMDDMIGGIPPSINVGQMNARFHLSKMSTTYNNALLENDQNLFDGVLVNNNGGITTSALSSKSELPFVPSMTASSNSFPSKRTVSPLYWNEEDVPGTSSNKRLSLDNNNNGNNSVVRTDHENGTANSIVTLLNQLPQTPPFHQQTMLGFLGDGLLRTPDQIPGMNWYA